MPKSVLVAMSGGVDSSVAAALLKERGFAVTGATMKIWDEAREIQGASSRVCCSLSAVEDAMAVCEQLEIPYRLLEYQEYFKTEIVENFCREYALGRTPNPCILCNTRLKFHHFLSERETQGYDYIATGHYARIGRDDLTDKFLLKRGKDPAKDQSYFLCGVTQRVLSGLLFPVGDYAKGEVRALAEKYRLPVAQKRESQEVCFIPDNDYAAFLKRRLPHAWEKGDILDREGNVVGFHEGTMGFTIGQRRGLGVAHTARLYVVDIDPEANVIVVGEKEDLLQRKAVVAGVNWISGSPPEGSETMTAKIRYRHRDAEMRLESVDAESRTYCVTFNEPQDAMTPGQSMVFYSGPVVLGGGVIEKIL